MTESNPKDLDENLYGKIERFVKIKIMDKEYEVPEKLEMLRVFQYLEFDIDYSRLCWNGSCQRCMITFEEDGKRRQTLCCRKKSFEGMEVQKLPATIKAKASS
jgi:NADH dehydrogenase/NADH:ubiquinone oxidoreductase subunit G